MIKLIIGFFAGLFMAFVLEGLVSSHIYLIVYVVLAALAGSAFTLLHLGFREFQGY